MVITPNSDVILLKCPLELSQDNQINFSNATTQYNYFYGLSKYIAGTNFTYQRKDGVIRVPVNFDSLIEYNYVMYRNDNYSNKWFYAFIENMEYVNDNMTAVKIRTDTFQTWQFDLTYKRCFIEREHVNDDTVGKNILPENVELGDYVINGTVKNNCLLPTTTQDPTTETNVMYICFQVSDYPDGNGALTPTIGDDVSANVYNGVYSGLDYLFVLVPEQASRLIRCYDKANKADSIVSIFQVPIGVVSDLVLVNYRDNDNNLITIGTLPSGYNPTSLLGTTLTKPTTIDSYTPVNKKLLTFPYCYFYASNNAGTEVQYNYEDFNGNPAFSIDAAISQGMSIKAYPTNYKKGTGKDGYNFGINCGKLPVCAWNSDYYTNWCTQNAINMPMSVASSVMGGIAGVAGSVMSHNPIGVGISVANAFVGVQQAMSRDYEASIAPDQARGNSNCGDINIAEKRFGFTFYPMSIKSQYAQLIDSYFSMYGYQVNSVKVPNITGRANWNYVKTVGSHILADIPQEDLQEIKNMFDNGITIWHNTSTFMDYSQSNAIV